MSQPHARAEPRSRRRGWLVLLAFVLVAAIGTVIVLQARGRSRRQAAIDRVIIAHGALMPADLALPADRRGHDPSEWLARVANVRNAWELADVADPAKYRTLLEACRGGRNGEDARVAFERFEGCIRPWLAEQKDPVGAWNDYWADLSARLQGANGTRAWGECGQAAVQLLAAGLEPSMKLAREAREFGAIDPQRVAMQLDTQNVGFPVLPLLQEARLSDAVQVTAMFDTWSHRYAEALDDVRAGLAMARVHEPPQWLIADRLWALHVGRALDTLQMMLPDLPRGLDVSDVRAQLTALSPGDELATALKGERAFGNRVFESLRSGWRPAGGAPYAPSSLASRIRRWLVGDTDQAAYLDALTQAVDVVTQPSFLRKKLPDAPPRSFWTPVTSIVLPAIEGPLAWSDALEARLGLARIALAAYAEDAKAALTLRSQTVDPYDGQPLRLAFGKEDLIVIWSIGPDKKDDMASAGSDDIVWPLRLQE